MDTSPRMERSSALDVVAVEAQTLGTTPEAAHFHHTAFAPSHHERITFSPAGSLTPCRLRSSSCHMKHQLKCDHLPESDALSPSAPRKDSSSAPISRRKLQHSTGTVRLASGKHRQFVSSSNSSSCNSSPTTPRADTGRPWRDRLASMKALLGVGTDNACREVLAARIHCVSKESRTVTHRF